MILLFHGREMLLDAHSDNGDGQLKHSSHYTLSKEGFIN